MVGDTLDEAGVPVDHRPVAEVGHVGDFSGVVFGAPLYMGRFPRDAGLRELGTTAWLQLVAVRPFGGAVDPDKLRFPFSRMRRAASRTGRTSGAGRAISRTRSAPAS